MLTQVSNPLISIVIPVFNGAKYIEKTIASILMQTFQNFELICIDDCSDDQSISILKKIQSTDKRILLYENRVNQGTASRVLNIAKKLIKGNFFVYASQDDLFSADWLEKMFRRATETGADATIPDVVFYYENSKKNNILSGYLGNRNAILSNVEALTASLEWKIPGFALWRSSLIQKIGFETFSFNADEYSVRKFFLECNKVAFSEGTFFYRQDNDEAITKKIGPKNLTAPITYFELYKLLKEENFPFHLYAFQAEKAVSCLFQMQCLVSAGKVQGISEKEAYKSLKFVHIQIQSLDLIIAIVKRRSVKSLGLAILTHNYFVMRLASKIFTLIKKHFYNE